MEKRLKVLLTLLAIAILGIAIYANPFLTCATNRCTFGQGYYLTYIGNGYHPYTATLGVCAIALAINAWWKDIVTVFGISNHNNSWPILTVALLLVLSTCVLE